MTKSRRRSQIERSADTRERLRVATVEVLLTKGYVNASTVEICRQAGVSRGAMLHHYPTKRDLMIDTARQRFERARAEMEHLAGALSRGDLTVAEFVEGMWDEVFPQHAVILTLETLVAARSDVELGHAVGGFFKEMVTGYETVAATAFADAGFSPEQRHVLVLLTACAIRGLRYQELMHFDPKQIDNIKTALRYAIEAVLAAGPEKLDRAIAPTRRKPVRGTNGTQSAKRSSTLSGHGRRTRCQ